MCRQLQRWEPMKTFFSPGFYRAYIKDTEETTLTNITMLSLTRSLSWFTYESALLTRSAQTTRRDATDANCNTKIIPYFANYTFSFLLHLRGIYVLFLRQLSIKRHTMGIIMTECVVTKGAIVLRQHCGSRKHEGFMEQMRFGLQSSICKQEGQWNGNHSHTSCKHAESMGKQWGWNKLAQI